MPIAPKKFSLIRPVVEGIMFFFGGGDVGWVGTYPHAMYVYGLCIYTYTLFKEAFWDPHRVALTTEAEKTSWNDEFPG